MNPFFKKIIIPVLVVWILAPFLVRGEEIDLDLPREELLGTTQTNQPQGGQQNLERIEGKLAEVKCGINSILTGECITKGIAWVSFTWLKIVGVLLNISGFVFNAALGVTIDDANYSTERIPALGDGWRFSRDVVNIFFIFILLFIAIATILQIESYGAKRLLANLIIIALLVNFSLLAAQAIIYVTNALTVTLYEAQGNVQDATSGTLFNLRFKKNFSEIITSGFQPQRLLSELPLNEFESTNVLSIMLAIIEVAVLGSIIILAAAFVLFVGALFLITRMALLWLLIILAPFGFVLLILPLTRGYAQTWWRTLQSQAIFAPVFMFLLAITAIIIQNSFPTIFARVGQVSGMAEFLFLIFMQSTLTIVLLLASLLVAKQMGIMGANAAMGWAGSAGKWFKGYAGRTGWRQFGGATTTAAIAAVGPAVARQLSRIPLVGRPLGWLTRGVTAPVTRGAAYAQAQARKTFDDQAKAFTNLPPNQLARVLATAPPGLQRAILEKVKDKRREFTLKAMGEDAAVRLGRNTKGFGLDKDVAKATNNPTIALRIMHPDLEGKEGTTDYDKAMEAWLDGLNNKELGNIDPGEIKKEVVFNAILRTSTPQRFNQLLRNRDQRDAVVERLDEVMIRTRERAKEQGLEISTREEAEALTNLIRKANNPELAAAMEKNNYNLAVNLIMKAVKVRGEAGEIATTATPAETPEEGTTT